MRVGSIAFALGAAAFLWQCPALADSATGAQANPLISLDGPLPNLATGPDGRQADSNDGGAQSLANFAAPAFSPTDFSLFDGAYFDPDVLTLSTSNLFADTTIALASDLHIRTAVVTGQSAEPALPVLSDLDQLQLARSADSGSPTLLAGADWNFASWGGLGLVASQSTQAGSDLDIPIRLQVPGSKLATMVGVTGHLSFGDGWVTSFSFDESRTQLDLRPNTLDVQGRGFGVEVSKKGLFDNDTFGIAVIRPPANSTLDFAPGGSDQRLLGSQISLSSATPETDFELGYETFFNGNITLQANAAYQMNVAGQSGTKGVSLLSRAKINF